MDPIRKALRKLTGRERKHISELLQLIQAGRFAGLDVRKLKGREDVFRVRKGDFRIIYRVTADGSVFVLALERRSEHTYSPGR